MSALTERPTCPACGSGRRRSILRCRFLDRPVLDFVEVKFAGRPFADRLAHHHYELLECEQCLLIYQLAVPQGSFLTELYDDWLNIDDGRESGGRTIEMPRAVEMAREVASIVRTLGVPSKEVRLLDFGMGWGHWCATAQALGCQSAGWDLSPQRRAHARSLGVRVPESEDALQAMQFDAINSEQVLEHVIDPAATVRRLLPTLRPGGIVRIGVPDGRHVKAGLDSLNWADVRRSRAFMRHLMPITPLIHINTFTATSLGRFGRLLGMEPLQPTLRAEWAILPGATLRSLAIALIRPLHRRLVPTTWMHFRWHGPAARPGALHPVHPVSTSSV